LAAAAFPLGDVVLYEQCWQDALALYEAVGDAHNAAMRHHDLAQCAKDREDHAAAIAHLETACVLLESEPPGADLGWIYEHLANISCNMGRPRQTLAWADKTERLGAALDDVELQIAAMHDRGRALRDLGEIPQAVSCLQRCVAANRDAGFIQSVLADYLHLGWTWRMLGEYRQALSQMEAGFALADRHGWRQRMDGDFGGHLGAALLELGQWERAQEALRWALDAAAQGHPWARRVAGPWQAELWLRQGRLREARRTLEQLVPDAVPGGLLQELWPIMARVRLAQGEEEAALAALAHVVRDWRARESPVGQERMLAWVVEVYVVTGHAEDAAWLMSELSLLAVRTGTPAAQGSGTEAHGLLAAGTGKHLEAAEAFASAAAVWQRQGARYLEAHARRLRAESLLRTGDRAQRDEAGAELTRARAATAAIGARLETEAIAAVARHYGVLFEAPELRTRHSDVLTRREHEVLQLLCRGGSNRSIAVALAISERTAEHHVASILAKRGFTSRVQLIASAGEHEPTSTPC
jgi:DNA-binding CsgD family transcriptional regulator